MALLAQDRLTKPLIDRKVGMAIAFLAGGAMVWLSALAERRRARRAEHTVKLLEDQVRELKAKLPQAELPPPS